jgi:hypothetical protein
MLRPKRVTMAKRVEARTPAQPLQQELLREARQARAALRVAPPQQARVARQARAAPLLRVTRLVLQRVRRRPARPQARRTQQRAAALPEPVPKHRVAQQRPSPLRLER